MPSRTRTPRLWDPYAILKIDNAGRCAGWARTRGRNCAMTVALRNQQNADYLIEAMSTKEPDPIALENDLYRLAGFLLCIRWHQDQADVMVAKWSASMERLAAVEEEERSRPRRSSAGRSSSVASEASSYSGSSSRSSSSRSSTASSRTTSPSLIGSQFRAMESLMSQNLERIAQLEATIAALTARVAPTTEVASPDQAGDRSQAVTPAQVNRHTEAAAATPPALFNQSRSAQPTAPAERSASRAQLPLVSSSSSTPSLSTILDSTHTTSGCTITHVRRRAIDDECPICHEDFIQDDALPQSWDWRAIMAGSDDRCVVHFFKGKNFDWYFFAPDFVEAELLPTILRHEGTKFRYSSPEPSKSGLTVVVQDHSHQAQPDKIVKL